MLRAGSGLADFGRDTNPLQVCWSLYQVYFLDFIGDYTVSPFELFSDDKPHGNENKLSASDERRSSQVASRLSDTGRSPPSNAENHVASAEKEPMWFDHPPCYQYWVDRGMRVIKALGIELQHGVIR